MVAIEKQGKYLRLPILLISRIEEERQIRGKSFQETLRELAEERLSQLDKKRK